MLYPPRRRRLRRQKAAKPCLARHLTAALIADDGPHALAAAAIIEKGLERDLYTVALEREQRDAIVSVLEDVPLTALHAVRARDHAEQLLD
jgi:hypothetical protein